MSASALVAVNVQNDNVMLDGDRSGALGRVQCAQKAGGARAEETVPERRMRLQRLQVVRKDDSASTTRIHDILDADGDACADDLLHSEGMNDLRTVEGQLSSLRGRNAGKQSSRGDLARVSGEDAIDLLPDLQLPGLDANCNQCSTEISVSTSNGVQKTARNVAKEASDDWDLVAACLHLSG